MQLNETHDKNLTSWVSSANANTDFPIQNLPFAIFRRKGSNEVFRGGVAIGDQVLDLATVARLKLFDEQAQQAVEAAAGKKSKRILWLWAKHIGQHYVWLYRAPYALIASYKTSCKMR